MRSSRLAGEQGTLSAALLAGAREAVARIDLRTERGQHPHVGAIDVVPLVYVSETERGAACAEALVVAELLARELRLPVFLYGALGGGRTRADVRRGGIANLATRMRDGELTPDFGPRRPHPSAGATLVAARPPLVAFNVELAPPSHFGTAREIAASIREGGREGMPGLRAIAIELHTRERSAQVSMNVEDPYGLAARVDRRGDRSSCRGRGRRDRRARAPGRARRVPGGSGDPSGSTPPARSSRTV